MGLARATYFLGWLSFVAAIVERILLARGEFAQAAINHNVLPRNFFELSVFFFIASIATGHYCRKTTD